MSSLFDHPGALFYEAGIEIIHANWPAYPIGHGVQAAMENLSCFSRDTIFYPIDDIDGILLCINEEPRMKEPFHPKYYHIALWHDDLHELNRIRIISGIQGLTPWQWEFMQFENLAKSIPNPEFDPAGNLILHDEEGNSFIYKKPEVLTLNEDNFEAFVWAPSGKFQLTEFGKDQLDNSHSNYEINRDILERVGPVIEINYFDTAVREASIMLEMILKKLHCTNDYGQRLVNLHCEVVRKKFGEAAYLKWHRTELRTFFNFIRNPYAHNFPITSKQQSINLIKRISRAYEACMKLME
jgi:hypothetical protein